MCIRIYVYVYTCMYVYIYCMYVCARVRVCVTSFSLSFSTPNWISTATSRASGAWMCLVNSGTQDSSWNAATRSRVVVSWVGQVRLAVCPLVLSFVPLFFSYPHPTCIFLFFPFSLSLSFSLCLTFAITISFIFSQFLSVSVFHLFSYHRWCVYSCPTLYLSLFLTLST